MVERPSLSIQELKYDNHQTNGVNTPDHLSHSKKASVHQSVPMANMMQNIDLSTDKR